MSFFARLARQDQKRAFTLLELIVVIVILGVLAAISIPTFSRVIERAEDEATLTTLRAVAKDAQALRAFEAGAWDEEEDIELAIQETSYAASPGLSAAGAYTPVKSPASEPTATQIAYLTEDEKAALSMRSPSGRVCVVAFDYSSLINSFCAPAKQEGPTLTVTVVTPPGPGTPSSSPSPTYIMTSPDPIELTAPEGTATPGQTTLTYTFAEVRGATKYRLICTASSSSKSAITTESPITLTGLTSDTLYTCTSEAGNSVSWSPKSAPFQVKTLPATGTLENVVQYGTSVNDFALGVATSSDGTVYTGGYTRGDLGSTPLGADDAFIRAYSEAGTLSWTRQFGTTADDRITSIAAASDGTIYAAGYTAGTLAPTRVGSFDAFLRAYSSSGDVLWTRQFGSSVVDYAHAVAAGPNGQVYVVGETAGTFTDQTRVGLDDAFVRAFDASGTALWTRQFGTTGDDFAQGVTTGPTGTVYVTGYTGGTFSGQTKAGGEDTFVQSLSPAGELGWAQQYGSSGSDYAYDIVADGTGTLYLAGYTGSTLPGQANSGGNDVFVRSLTASGEARWTRQFGTSGSDLAYGVAVDQDGHVYVTGSVTGRLGTLSAGGQDVFARSYDAAGIERWTQQFGSSGHDFAHEAASAPDGSVYLAGQTTGALSGTNAGATDAFLAKLK